MTLRHDCHRCARDSVTLHFHGIPHFLTCIASLSCVYDIIGLRILHHWLACITSLACVYDITGFCV